MVSQTLKSDISFGVLIVVTVRTVVCTILHVILQVDTDVSMQHAASIFRAEVCRVSSWLCYTGGWSLGSLGGGKEMESSLGQMGMVGRKMPPVATQNIACV